MANNAVTAFVAFPPDNVGRLTPAAYDKQILSYIQSINKLPESAWTKPVGKQSLLDLLDPAVNSIAYLTAICYQSQAAGKDKSRSKELLARANHFVTCFDPVQIRYAGPYWGVFMSWFFEASHKLGDKDLRSLSTAMLRLDPTGGTFTSHHLRLLEACLDLGVPSQALPILEKNIYAFPQSPAKGLPEEPMNEDNELSNWFINAKSQFTAKIGPEDVLQYYMIGAHIYIGLRNYNRARLFLESVILTPTLQHGTSELQVEAYKKWILTGLLAQGKLFSEPRTADPLVMKSLKAIARPYESLAQDFDKRDWKKYQAELDVGTQIWFSDGNMSIVREAGDALLRYRIIDMQKTYAALPVNKVASHIELSPDETVSMLTTMIQQGHLDATLTPNGNSSADTVLRFSLDPSSTVAGDDDLEAQTARIEQIVTSIRDADRRLQISKEYVENQKRAKRSGAGPDGDLADQMDLTWDAPLGPGPGDGDDEEDIMAG